jgi:hypothetical protein
VIVKFTHEAILKGYSFKAGEIHKFPKEISELIISSGVAFQVSSGENAVNQTVNSALNEAKQRDLGHR